MNAIAALMFSAMLTAGGEPQGELLNFSASWCGPCQSMAPVVSQLQRHGWPIRRVDVDQNRDLAKRYGVGPIPAFVLVIEGKAVVHQTGIQTEADLIELMRRIPRAPVALRPEVAKSPPVVLAGGDAPRFQGVATVPQTPVKLASTLGANSAVVVSGATSPVPEKSSSSGPLSWILKGPHKSVSQGKSPRSGEIVRANLDDQSLLHNVPLTDDPMSASTRIRVTDKSGINFGSGTIIESRIGQTLILTCGHLFRNIREDAQIEVDVFLDKKAETYVAKLIKFDLDSDLGLISISTDQPLSTVRVGSGTVVLDVGQSMRNVGCDGGKTPTLQTQRVTAINPYKGPANLECTGFPVQGRSGGGLFNESGELVAVCIAQVPSKQRGWYSSLPAIHQFLTTCQLARLYLESPEALVENATETAGKTGRPRGIYALRESLGDLGDEEIVCVVRPSKESTTRKKIVVLSGK